MQDTHNLEGRVVLVTGAARGIGKAVCRAFADSGCFVIATDVLEDEVMTTARELGEKVTAHVHDVTSEAQWKNIVQDTLAKHGHIDGLINNAGILFFSTLETTQPEKFRKLMEVNVMGTFLGLQAVIPCMKEARSGAIVNLSSSSAVLPNNGTGAYAASKFAVRGLTRTSALELAPYGIRVNSVHPGGVNTPMTNPQGLEGDALNARFKFVPQQRGCEPHEVANMVRFLVSDQASYCNGAEMVVDGGLTAGQYFYGIPGAPY